MVLNTPKKRWRPAKNKELDLKKETNSFDHFLDQAEAEKKIREVCKKQCAEECKEKCNNTWECNNEEECDSLTIWFAMPLHLNQDISDSAVRSIINYKESRLMFIAYMWTLAAAVFLVIFASTSIKIIL